MKSGVHKKIKIIGCYVGESQEKKTPFFGLEFKNEEGETIEKDFFFSADKQDYNEKIVQQLIDAGYKGKSLADMADPKLSIADLFGEPKDELNITVKEESYLDKDQNPKTRQAVQWFNVGYGGQKSKADHAGAKMIFKNSSFDGLFAKMKKEGPKPKEAKAPKESMQADVPLHSDDDVPF